MKKKLKPYYGMVNGREELLVSLKNFRDTYSNEIKKHPILMPRYARKNKDGKKAYSSGTPRSAWVAILGIPTISIDGAKQRCSFRYESLTAALSVLKWEADEEEFNTQETIFEDETEEAHEEQDGEKRDVLYSVDSVQTLLLQMIDQKLDCILKEHGVSFVLDESKLLKLQKLKD